MPKQPKISRDDLQISAENLFLVLLESGCQEIKFKAEEFEIIVRKRK